MRPGRLFKLRGIEHLHRSLFAIGADRCGADPAAADLCVFELAVSKLGHVVLEAPVRDLSANTAGDGRWTGGNRGNGLAGERSAVPGGDSSESSSDKADGAAGTHPGTAAYDGMTGWTVHTAAESIPITDQYAVTSLSRSRSLFSISLTSF